MEGSSGVLPGRGDGLSAQLTQGFV